MAFLQVWGSNPVYPVGQGVGRRSGATSACWAALELTRDFFWSYGWPLWRTVQANLGAGAPGCPFDSMYVWNDFLTRRARYHPAS